MPDAVTLFLFRRDFRLEDNPAWIRASAHAARTGTALVPAFAFSDSQTLARRNAYFSAKAFAALLSLLDAMPLAGARLTRLRAPSSDADLLALLHASATPLSGVFFNRDFTPFARERDASIEAWCEGAGVHCDCGEPGDGYTLWPTGSVLNRGGTVPKTFSAFERAVSMDEFRGTGNGLGGRAGALGRGRVSDPPRAWRPFLADAAEMRALAAPETAHFRPPGAGEAAALLLAVKRGDHDRYGETRNDFTLPGGTLHASALLKFGALSPRALMRAAVSRKKAPELVRQLLWREYYAHLAAGYPELLSGKRNSHIRPDRQRAVWSAPDAAKLRAWERGETGEPLVDAAMRRLRDSGWMHNRLRMVVASHLVKVLRQDWRQGERIFARMLVDYDPASNSGGWQSADAALDARAIKARTQQLKYDRGGQFVQYA